MINKSFKCFNGNNIMNKINGKFKLNNLLRLFDILESFECFNVKFNFKTDRGRKRWKNIMILP